MFSFVRIVRVSNSAFATTFLLVIALMSGNHCQKLERLILCASFAEVEMFLFDQEKRMPRTDYRTGFDISVEILHRVKGKSAGEPNNLILCGRFVFDFLFAGQHSALFRPKCVCAKAEKFHSVP